MARAEFEEREFESAFNAELVASYGFARHLWTPGTVIEEVLGFDLAAGIPARDAIWRVLGVPRPRGVRLLPDHWLPGARPSGARLPSMPVSLMLQFKRPEYLASNASKQYRLWRSPYYRFTRDARQHKVLRRVEQRATSEAIVRYAAPAFHTCADLERARLAGNVCAESGFVSPARLGNHSVWTYQAAGREGRANPSGERISFETVYELGDELTRPRVPALLEAPENANIESSELPGFGSLATQDLAPPLSPPDELEPLAAHLAALSSALTYRSPTLRRPLQAWRRALAAADLGLGARTYDVIVNMATIQTAMTAIGTSWLVFSA